MKRRLYNKLFAVITVLSISITIINMSTGAVLPENKDSSGSYKTAEYGGNVQEKSEAPNVPLSVRAQKTSALLTTQSDGYELPFVPIETNHYWDEGTVTTPPTCTQAGVKTYTCKYNSSHTYTEVIPADGHKPAETVYENGVAATCSAEGSYDEVVYCSVCKQEISREKKTIPVDEYTHNWGDRVHTKDPTCCETGYTGDSYCTDCHKTIKDGTDIPATGKHIDVDGKWEAIETEHWHTCYYGTKFDISSHTGGEATCTEKAKCSVCEAEYGEYAEHHLTHHDYVEPDYENDGNIEYWTCDECGKYFTDLEANNEISADEVIIAKIGFTEYQFFDGEVIVEAPDGAIPKGSRFNVQKIIPPPTDVVKEVKDQLSALFSVLSYYEVTLSETGGALITQLNHEITIKIKMPKQYAGNKYVQVLQKKESGKLITMTSWWESEYLCYKTDWLEIYN